MICRIKVSLIVEAHTAVFDDLNSFMLQAGCGSQGARCSCQNGAKGSVRLKDLSLIKKLVSKQVSNFVFPDLTSISLNNQVWKDYC